MVRWLTATLVLVCLVLAAAYALWHYHAYHSSSHTSRTVPITGLVSPPPPEYVPHQVIAELLQRAGLPEYVPTEPRQHPAYLQRLLREFETTPWIRSVHYQEQPTPHLEVQWSRIVPITFCSQQQTVLAHCWANENAVVLAQSLPAPRWSLLPIFIYVMHPPVLTVGQALPPPFSRACSVALLLDAYRTQLGLQAIFVGQDPISLDLRLQTTGGSIVFWEHLDPPNPNILSDEAKLLRLLEYVRLWKSLDRPAGPYFFDNRFPQSLLRQPLP